VFLDTSLEFKAVYYLSLAEWSGRTKSIFNFTFDSDNQSWWI